MSRSTAIPLAFFVAVLLIGAVFMVGLDEDPVEEAAAAASVEARLAELEREVEQLRAEVRTLRGAGAPTFGPAPGAMALRGSTARPRVPGTLLPPTAREAASVGGQEVLQQMVESDDPEVRERFQELVRDELDSARSERWERRQQRRTERREARLEQLRADAGLRADQLGGLQLLLEDEDEQITDLFRAAREDGSFEEARDKIRELHAATDEEIAGLLDEDQYAAWQEMRDEGRRGRGR